MSSYAFLRSCFCSLVIICFVIDASAQRAGRRRVVTSTETPVTKSSIDTKYFKIPCNTIPREVFSRADLMRSQKELANLQYFTQDTIIETDQHELVSEKETKLPECRETKMLNKPDIADAYPFLSEDGLRLYYTSNREGGHGRFFISTRKTVHDPFGEPKVLSKHLTDGYYAGTLTADELTLCMVKSGSMYISIRKSKNEIFPEPVKVKGVDTDIYHFGPSISADGTEIVVTVSIGSTDRTRIYKRTRTYQVSDPKDLALPSVGEPGPGQLSKDGLHYYLSIETGTNEHLWRYSRASLSEYFSNLEELPEQMKGLRNILQPTLSKDGSVMAFVTAPSDTWSEDDILLVNYNLRKEPELPTLPAEIFMHGHHMAKKLPVKFSSPELMPYSPAIKRVEVPIPIVKKPTNEVEAKKPEPVKPMLQVKVYPNPFATSVRIEIDQLRDNGAIFNLYDISGKMIRQEKIYNHTSIISLEQLIAGTYTFQLINRKGERLSSGNLVKTASLKAF